MSRQDGVRATLYHRFYALVPFLSHPFFRRLWHGLVWGFWIVYFGFVALVLALRYSILPNIETYRPDVERLASQAVGQTISIGRIEASWEGINPDLSLLDVRIADSEGRPALAFSRIEAILSWWSVPRGQLKLRLLSIDEPTLNVRRDTEGHFFVAGIPFAQTQAGGGVSDWILDQRRIRIHGATVVWEDDLRSAPALVLEDLNLAIDNDGRQHRFGLTALPPEALASRIDLRGDFRGRSIERLDAWSGQVFAEIDYADLAVWQRWIDYPVALPRGRGAFRAWADVAEGRLSAVTTDVSLSDVNLRLDKALPALDLDRLSGRINARFPENGFEINGKNVELVTRSSSFEQTEAGEGATRIEPMDFHADWQPTADGKGSSGNASASVLDISALARLAGHLPFDAQARRLLAEYAPQGRVSMLTAKWKGTADALQTYSLKAGFNNLALKAQGPLPGFSGLSGVLDATEKGGSTTLNTQKSTFDLPAIFPVSLIELDSLIALARWKIDKGMLEVDLPRAEFSGPEAAGSAKGKYRATGDGPGYIDLTAALSRADARAVWRYMPHVVGAGARQWLRDSLLAGTSNDAKLTLKGNLNDFPFLDKRKGQFLVTVKARDVVLDYGKGWPRIDGIDGDLRFEGNGMVVDAQRGTLLGAKLSNTRAEIPDFDAPISTLIIKGKAEGPTSEFLKFIDKSPVADRIDRFTEDMRATGNGQLDLGLVIPLDESKLAQSKIDGTYHFKNNEVTVDAALPPIRQVNGNLKFSGSDLRIPEINGVLFGGPLKIKGGSQKDGRVLISANGSVNIAQLRKQIDSPLLENLSGVVPYRGEVQVNKRDADLFIESTLVGLSSLFPEPFSKSVNDVLPFRFEKKLLPAAAATRGKPADTSARDQISVALGNMGSAASLQLIRRKQNGAFVTERGAVAVGRALQLPESGFALGVTAKRLDLDAWRKILTPASTTGAAKPGSATPASSLPDSISLHVGDLLLFGRNFAEVDLAVTTTTPGQMKMYLNAPQASGDLVWESAGRGKLTARLKRLQLEPSAAANDPLPEKAVEELKELPALDVIAEDFSLGARRFGRLELQAINDKGVWRLNQVRMSNPHGELSGSGEWRIGGGNNRTQLAFKVDSNDVGKLLERVGYPGTVRAGTAKLEGKLGWNSGPIDLDFKSLSGEMSLEAAKGQFLKLDPGAAGKLLGLISLQSLPRRISLDFRDVFSKGFAFDSVASKIVVQNGLMRTDRLQIDGPSARVLMHGEVDLKHETQRLNVNVQPDLGGTAALGIALVNPVAGVATWVAHKMLQNPLNQIFGFDYLVTGNWDDPKVEKVSGTDPALKLPSPTTTLPEGAADDSAKQ